MKRKYFQTLRQLLLLVVILYSGLALNARNIGNLNQKFEGFGIDEHGLYAEFYVAYYDDGPHTPDILEEGLFGMTIDGHRYWLFGVRTADQDRWTDQVNFYSWICNYDFPMQAWGVDKKTYLYYPGLSHAGVVGELQYKYQRMSCYCWETADCYVRVYLPDHVWGRTATFWMYGNWNGDDADGEVNLAENKTIPTPYLDTPTVVCTPSSTTGKMKATLTYKDANTNYSYLLSSSSITFSDKEASDGTVVGEYAVAADGKSASVSLNLKPKDQTKYKSTLYETWGDENSGKEFEFTISETGSQTNSVTLAGCTYVKNLTTDQNQFKKSITLSWDKEVVNDITNGTYYIYRYTLDSNGEETEGKMLVEKLNFGTCTYTDQDEIEYDKTYRYIVFFVPTEWQTVSSPIMELGDTDDVTTLRTFPIDLKVTGNEANVSLSWTYPQNNGNVTYKVYRKYGSNSWGAPIYTTTISSSAAGTSTYTDTDLAPNTIYSYKVETTVMDMLFTSNTGSAKIGKMTRVTSFTASKGECTDRVKLTWNAKQVGTSDTQFRIFRKLLNSDDDFKLINIISGTGSIYYYEDVTVLPGQFYKYRVSAYPAGAPTEDGTPYEWSNDIDDDGFCISKGIVNGRVTFGTGTAVPDVKVVLTADSKDNESAQFYSTYISDCGGGITVPITEEMESKMFTGNKPFTAELWVRPNTGIKQSSISDSYSNNPMLFTVNAQFGVETKRDETNPMRYQLVMCTPDGKFDTGLYISSIVFSHVSLSNDGKGNWSVRLIDGETVKTFTKTCTNVPALNSNGTKLISIGSPEEANADYTFMGYVDEFRLWSKCLTDAEVLKYSSYTLSGSENGLKCYLPMDEGITDKETVYDYSKTSGVTNGNHGTFKTSTVISETVPDESQLSLHSYTDEQGNYTVMGVPFSGEGTSYTIRPTLGIHKFSPQYKTRFFNANSLNHDGVDFEDVSSFSVSGRVLYENTDYPVAGCNIYVDGTICAREGSPIESDADGKFTISVPIGSHYITIKKNGHEFVNMGRYPADPLNIDTLFTFTKDISSGQPLMFYDKTLVNFTGRVVGGDIQGSKPLGFGLSQNNLGVAEVVIVPTSDAYYLNYDNQAGEKGTSTISCESATDNIGSTSWRGAGSGNENKKIYIKTDSETGEFSVMVPPLSYNVESIRILSNSEVLFKNLPTIDLTNPLEVSNDTLSETGELYEYNYALRQTYHSDPIFSVIQEDANLEAFGIENYELWENETKYDVQVFHEDGTGSLTYDYDYPIFVSGDNYTFKLSGYEHYVNKDNQEIHEDNVPLSGTVVTIQNAMSSSQSVYTEDGTTTEGETVKAGDIYNLEDNQLALDSLGLATYTWKAGLPNISEPYTRTISMSFAIAGQSYDWTGVTGIVLGSMPTGNNFVTAGPDHLVMILRDPPGTNSKASWTSGSVYSKSTSDGSCWSEELNTSFKTMLGVKATVVSGIGVAKVDDVESKDNLTTGIKVTCEGENAKTTSLTISSSKTVSTKDTPEYVGANGDVFIGTSTNILFGEARNVGFFRDPSTGDISLDRKDIMTTGQSFETVFQYDQLYIENTLLPNLEKMRNSMLKYYGNDPVPANKTKYLKYISKLPEDDPNFGSSNSDKDVWGASAIAPGISVNGMSYYLQQPEDMTGIIFLTDSVNWCNLQIKAWKKYLAQNEEEKVKAYADREHCLVDNLSFDAGADVEQAYETSNGTGSTYEVTTGATVVINNEVGFAANSTGVLWTVENEIGGTRHEQESEETTNTVGFSYTLSEDGSDDAITVDILKYGSNSHIFRTRGGQTSNPYEGEVRTKYYEPDRHVLMEATMQIEVPDIAVEKAIVSNVPTGCAANFNLILNNFSEIGNDIYYRLLVVDESNIQGARILIDGLPLTEGRLIKIPANSPITKSVQLYQSDPSILDYEDIAIVLASQTQYDPTSTWDQIADTVLITAHFVPSSSPVTMELDKTLVNTNSVSESNPDPLLNITFKGFDRNYYNQKAFRIQYHAQGENDWRLLREYLLDESMVKSSSQEYLQDVASVTYQLNMKSMDDGQYTFRVLSACSYGLSEEITVSSEEITVTKDMNRPQVLGTPKPSTGILTQGDDIAITFNEDINSNMLTDSNFKVTAMLNEATIANDVAVLSNGDSEPSAQTDADINLSGKDFAMDMWVNVSEGSSGTIVAHGNGTNKFKVGVDAEGYLIVNIGDNQYKSDKKLKTDYWCYLNLNYSANVLSASYAYDAETVNLFSNRPVSEYTGNGRLSVLSGINASLHDLTLWDEARPLDQLQSEMYVTKKPSTEGLIGYWRFDEGLGLSAADKARSRNMVVASENSWYMNVENKSVQLTGSNYISLNTSACSVLSSDDYALEMWFKADTEQPTANSQQPTLFSLGENLALRFTESGLLELTSNGFRLGLGSKAYNDTQWHHFALNVLRNGSTTAYIDGEAVGQTSSKNIGYMQSDALILGAKRSFSAQSGYTFDGFLSGAIDDVRIWNATLNASILRSSKDTRLAGNEDGLVAYYPFENLETDQYNQQVTVAYPGDKVSGTATATSNSQLQYVSGPAQTPAKTLSGVGYTFVASERTVVINLTEAADLVEGTTVNITVRDVRDMNGNYSEPIKWTAYVNRNQLVWKDSEVSLKYEMGLAGQFSATVKNNSAVTEQWSISGMPSWLQADMTQGTLTALTSQAINFTVSDAVQIGTHELTLFLSGNNGIKVPLSVRIIVAGDEPDWAVNPADYENNMTIFGQIKVKGKISENTGDMVAAFIDGECRGVGSPVYYPRYDSYLTQMMVYGNNDDKKPVEFKIWNASEGKVYPVVSCYHDGSPAAVTYTANADLGAASNPFVWDAENKIEETLALQKGWNWTSLYVQNDDMSVGNMLSGINTDGNTVKSFDSYAQADGNGWSGSLSDLSVGKMYMIKSVSADGLTMSGAEVNAQSTPITVIQNWNWIGLNASYKISLDQAFAELTPETNDVVKSQTAFATYDGYEWIGRLTALVPGQGYMYKSYADTDKAFKYPSRASVTGSLVKERTDGIVMDALFDIDRSVYYSYPNNMTIIARVMDGENVVEDAQVGVFDSDRCRDASAVGDRNLVFLIVPGDKAEPLRLEVVSGNQRYTLSQTLGFEVNGSLGTVENPYIIQIGGATSIEDVEAAADDTEAYNTAGLKVGKDYKGVTIKNGEKYFDRK